MLENLLKGIDIQFTDNRRAKQGLFFLTVTWIAVVVVILSVRPGEPKDPFKWWVIASLTLSVVLGVVEYRNVIHLRKFSADAQTCLSGLVGLACGGVGLVGYWVITETEWEHAPIASVLVLAGVALVFCVLDVAACRRYHDDAERCWDVAVPKRLSFWVVNVPSFVFFLACALFVRSVGTGNLEAQLTFSAGYSAALMTVSNSALAMLMIVSRRGCICNDCEHGRNKGRCVEKHEFCHRVA